MRSYPGVVATLGVMCACMLGCTAVGDADEQEVSAQSSLATEPRATSLICFAEATAPDGCQGFGRGSTQLAALSAALHNCATVCAVPISSCVGTSGGCE